VLDRLVRYARSIIDPQAEGSRPVRPASVILTVKNLIFDVFCHAISYDFDILTGIYVCRVPPSIVYIKLINPRRGIAISEYSIQNVVASANLGTELDLNALAVDLSGAEYEPQAFPGLVFRLKEPKTATLLFRSGKLVCTGAKTLDQLKLAIETVVKKIREAGVPIKGTPTFEVQNIVASADLGQSVNLTATVISLGLENVEYEPEVFPGLVYRLANPKVVILLFGSGRLVCTGARTPKDIGIAVDKIKEELRAADLLM
jgi:transcription initiation factor TFIID TATA-box-binding protein